MGFKSLLPRAATLLMEALGIPVKEGRLIGLAQMLQISQVIIMALALRGLWLAAFTKTCMCWN